MLLAVEGRYNSPETEWRRRPPFREMIAAMRNVLSTAARTLVALIVWAVVGKAFMSFAGGAAMYCVDPPAADPGWEWKVPAAWATIYGVSTVAAVLLSCIRVPPRAVPWVVAAATILAVVLVRARHFDA